MRTQYFRYTGRIAPVAIIAVAALGLGIGCGGNAGSLLDVFFGTPFTTNTGGGGTTTGPGSTGTTPGGGLSGGSTSTDPCAQSQPRKLIRISMRNLSDDYVHYFLIMIAYVNGTTYPNGAVCPTDVGLYTSNGYVQVAEGAQVTLGNLCIKGPALYYFHRNGQFRMAGSGAASNSLASAIAPAQGSSPTYDAFFSSAGASLPVPNEIIFHNPGTGAGAALKVSLNRLDPCATEGNQIADPPCDQDAFYYVDQGDLLVGSTALGFNSGIRVPSEIQGTGCGCGLSNSPSMVLAPANLTGADVVDSAGQCNAFLRGGRVDFVFVHDDTDPPYPQLLWRVTDANSSVAHDFDPRAGL